MGIPDSISSANNNGLDSDKQNYRPPTSWSTGKGRPNTNLDNEPLTGAASHRPGPTIQSTPEDNLFTHTTPRSVENTPTSSSRVTPPSQDFLPPFPPTTEANSEDIAIDARMKNDDPVINFINRFDPNSPDSIKTSMSKSEILSINQQLPLGQSSAEDERTPRKQKNVGNDFNRLQNNGKGDVKNSRFDTVNLKPAPTEATIADSNSRFNQVPTPGNELLPPKNEFSKQPLAATTEGPAVYYEWKWAGPAQDLEPPKASNQTSPPSGQEKRNVSGLSPFSKVTRPPPVEIDAIPPTKNSEYNISSYFVPDYIFPLDKPHPGYDDENAETSFQVKVARPGRASYGENPACPQCHPAYLNPGTCEPCIVKR